MSNWREFDRADALDRAMAEYLAQRLRDDIAERGAALLAVSGGNTPKGMFQRLSRQPLAWSRVTITLVDERWVELEDPDSNEQLLRQNLLQNDAAEATLVGLKSAPADPVDGLVQSRLVAAQLPLPFTAVVLGMGGDGHTASWFPRASNLSSLLDPTNEQRLDITDPVTAPHPRITFTLGALLQSREILLHFTGPEKRAVLAQAATEQYPVVAATGQTTTPVTIWWAP